MPSRLIIIYLLSFVYVLPAKAFEGPTMGWSSWNTYRVNISDSLIMHQADELVRLGLDSAGYRFVNIDDGFFGGRDSETGRLLFNMQRFPGGMRPVVEHIHRLGLKAGIYSDAGRNTCGNFWDNDTIARGVGLYGHDTDDCRLLFGELGFDFIKVDFCGGDPRQNTDSLCLDPKERYMAIRNAINDTDRRAVRMNICRWDYPGTWASEMASSWRISHDISPTWESIRDIIGQNLYLSAYAGKGHYNDMDMLEIGRGLTADEERTHFGIWCIMSSPLLIGCDLSSLNAEALRLLKNKELTALNQDSLGLQAYVAKHTGGGAYVLVKDIVQRNGLTRAVAFYNPTDSVTAVSIGFKEVDLAGKVCATDLFTGATATHVTDSMTVALRPHSTEIYRLEAEYRLPRIRYEAETAYLPFYQELENPIAVKTAYYDSDSDCSGGMKVTNAGGRPGNDIIFRDIHIPAEGLYAIRLRFRATQTSAIQVNVNGHPIADRQIPTTASFIEMDFRIPFKTGNNLIRLSSASLPLPEIDYIEIDL